MKVVLVDVPTYQVLLATGHQLLLESRTIAEFKLRDRRMGFVPIRPELNYSRGLLIVAKSLRDRQIKFDYVVYSDEQDRERLPELLKQADILALNALTPTVDLAAGIASNAKVINPSILTIVGGPHVQIMPRETLSRYHSFDFAVAGPGEIILPKLLQNIGDFANIPCVFFRDSNNLIMQSQTHDIFGYEHVPPDYECLFRPASEYSHNIRTTEGCIFGCNFCYERRSWRGTIGIRSLDAVIEELDFLASKCPDNTLLHFSDAVFTFDRERTLKLCTQLKRFRGRFYFSVDTRADSVDKEIIEAMSEAGIIYVRLGFEDGHNKILKYSNKGCSVETVIETAKMIRQISNNTVIHAYWLTGLPGSNHESIVHNSLLIQQLIADDIVDIIGNRILVPYPGTDYYDFPEKYQMKILSRDWSRYDRLSFPVFRLGSLSEFEIYDGFMFLESILLQAYADKLGADVGSRCESRDYRHYSYLSKDCVGQ